MNLKYKTVLSILLLGGTILFGGCQQTGLYDYSSPEATYRTYTEQAKTLMIVADHRHYRRAIRCFSDSDWKWFENNFDNLAFEREDSIYENLYLTKKKAYAFGRAVVSAGPSPYEEDLSFTEVSPGVFEIEVAGYPDTIRFVRVRRGWVMEGLFGLREEPGV